MLRECFLTVASPRACAWHSTPERGCKATLARLSSGLSVVLGIPQD